MYEIDSGIYDITKIGTILSWNNMTTLNNWKGKSCNRISGTDATIFRPYLDMDGIDSINVFNGEICRYFNNNINNFLKIDLFFFSQNDYNYLMMMMMIYVFQIDKTHE